MAIDYKPLLEQFEKDYRESRTKELLADIKRLQADEPRMSFDEAWNRSLPAYPSLSEEEAGLRCLAKWKRLSHCLRLRHWLSLHRQSRQ